MFYFTADAYYAVELKLHSPIDGHEKRETVLFKSCDVAKYMAQKYAQCADVVSIDVVDQTTGEVIFACDAGRVTVDAGNGVYYAGR